MSEVPEQSATFIVRWKVVAICSLLINVGVITGIVVLALNKKTDGLATVALSLAVLAFISQLVIFVWQTIQSSGQVNQARDLNHQTLGLVLGMKAQIARTHDMVESAIRERHEVTQLKVGGDDETEEGIPQTAASPAVAKPRSTPTDGASSQFESSTEKNPEVETTQIQPQGLPIDGGKETLLKLVIWPSDTTLVDSILTALEGLDEFQISSFIGNTVVEVIHFTSSSVPRGLNFAPRLDQPLIDLGYCVDVGERIVDGVLKRQIGITAKGIEAASLLFSPWPPNEASAPYKDRLWALRSSLKEEAASAIARSRERLEESFGVPNEN